MAEASSKQVVADWLTEWYPVLIPLLLFFGRILMTERLGVYNRFSFPSDLCYYGTTFYVWALTTKLNGQDVSLRPMIGKGEWYLVVLLLLANFILYIVLYPVRAAGSEYKFFLSIVVAVLFGFGSPIYLRGRF